MRHVFLNVSVYISVLFAAVIMVWKKKAGGECSGSEESSGSGGQGGPPQRPVGRAPLPQQQGGGGGQGRGSANPQASHQGGHGAGYYQGCSARPQPRGGMASQQGVAPEYQGRGNAPQPRGTSQYEHRGRGGPQLRGGVHPHQYAGGRRSGGRMVGGHGADPSGGPTRLPAPELLQATQATYQASQPSPTPELSTSRFQPPDITFGQVDRQLQQLSVQGEDKPTLAIQTVASASSSKSMRFPLRPGMGRFGDKCIVKANHFYTELPDKDLHQYDV